jgi:hypothetical protein
MRFLRRNIHVLLFCAVLVLSSVLVIRQFMANLSAHVERREDFIALYQRGHAKMAEHLFEVLIRTFPKLSDSALWEDAHRTAMLIDVKTPQPNSLIWKYHFTVRNELARRTEWRLARVLKETEQ